MTTAPQVLEHAQRRSDHLRQSDDLFRQLAINIPQALWIRDIGRGTLRYINPTWLKMTGRSIAAGDPIEKLYAGFQFDDIQRQLLESKQFSDGGADFECQFARQDETLLWVHVRTFPIRNQEGEEFLIAGIMEDITARRKESRRIEQLKDDFVQVITNLLSNAVKFSPAGEEVKVAIESGAGTIKISVRDHGPGIPAEFKPRIFEKFVQADVSDKRQKGGTGLGLSIAKEIMTQLGGKVGFNDAPAGGAIFYIELPVQAPSAGVESAA